MAAIHITNIEAAINYWRDRKPSPDGVTLAPELRALAEVYALMVYFHEDEAAGGADLLPARDRHEPRDDEQHRADPDQLRGAAAAARAAAAFGPLAHRYFRLGAQSAR